MKFSIIIPTLNEEKFLKACVENIRALDENVEIIIADGGSSDTTVEIAELLKTKVIRCKQGRGTQQNAGAGFSSGDILLFLHADTVLPQDVFKTLAEVFKNEKVQVGTFRLKFDEPDFLFKSYAFFTRFDSIFTSFGDQCITVRKSFFNELGGFKNWPVFEDVEFLQRARKVTRIYRFKDFVITSARRFLKNGIVRQQFINARLIYKYLRGETPENLAEEYRK